MFARTIKKAIIFFIVDIVILIGIFVLQFSTDSIITEKFGNLQITLAETKDSENRSVLKNKMTLSFNGVTLSCDDAKPALIKRKGETEQEAVKLENWDKSVQNNLDFVFTDGITLHVQLNQDGKGAMGFKTDLPSDVENFYIPYTIAANSEIADSNSTRILLGSKKEAWELVAPSLENSLLGFSSNKTSASWSYFEQTVEFKFASLTDSVLVSSYPSAVASFRDNVISGFHANTADALTSEQTVVAYVAEQAARGNYKTAVDEIPQTFKRSTNRTYLSAPYFNSLSAMDDTLEADIKAKDAVIRRAADTNSLSLFTIRHIADYMYIYPYSSTIKKITENAGEAIVDNLSLAEAAGILRTYVEMSPLSKAYASHMEPALSGCVAKIEKACKMEGNNLTVSENGTFLSVVQAVEVGDALLRYGQYIGDSVVIAGGKAIISSYLGETSSFDMRTFSDLYPVVVQNNTYYPHFVKILTEGDNVIWAWTAAENIAYERGEGRTGTFTIDFPLEHTHYVIIRGVSPFRSIYIYDMAFRTDPRFETYNSSGYVYKAENKALLLKSRHKSEKETVRLTYGSAASAQPKQEENSSETPASTTETENSAEQPVETEVPAVEAAPEPAAPAPAQKSEAEIRALQAQAQAAAAARAAAQAAAAEAQSQQ